MANHGWPTLRELEEEMDAQLDEANGLCFGAWNGFTNDEGTDDDHAAILTVPDPDLFWDEPYDPRDLDDFADAPAANRGCAGGEPRLVARAAEPRATRGVAVALSG